MKTNPELNIGDRIIILNMSEEDSSVPPLTRGVVKRFNKTPFGIQIGVDWETGSKLDLIPEVDTWVLESEYMERKKKKLKESFGNNDTSEWILDNKDIIKNFNTSKISTYLELIRKSGIENMFGAAPLLYIGSEMLDRLYPYPPDEDAFEQAVEMADEIKNEMISGAMKYLKKQGKEIDVESVGRVVKKFSTKILEYFMRTK